MSNLIGILVLYLLVGLINGIWFTFDSRKTEFNRVTRALGIIIFTFGWFPLLLFTQVLRLQEYKQKI